MTMVMLVLMSTHLVSTVRKWLQRGERSREGWILSPFIIYLAFSGLRHDMTIEHRTFVSLDTDRHTSSSRPVSVTSI